jgi:heterodisulfide reductase subunit C
MQAPLQQLVFLVVIAATTYWAYRQYKRVFSNIGLGKKANLTNSPVTRLKNMALFSLGQKKMFKRWTPAILHAFIYVAFLFTQIELIEILIDGFSGSHRFFAGKIGILYPTLINFIEFLSLGALVATIVFLWRRNLLRIPRFNKAEMKAWPKMDANLILMGELLLIIGIFTMNGTDVLLQGLDPEHYPDSGRLLISDWTGPMLFGGFDQAALANLERMGWWLHIVVVLGFICYLPFSKHLHIFLAFPNAYYSKINPRGEMDNMPIIANEVRGMMGMESIAANPSEEMADGQLPEFGTSDVTELEWVDILGAYACTECGRCTDVCPANITGKKLSPRKVMMDIRDRAEEIGTKIASGNPDFIREEARSEGAVLNADNFSDGKNLFDYITPEEIHACTTCQACVEACPVLINPLDPILKMRRYEILTMSSGPAEWVPMFTAMENSGAVWQVTEDREKWARDINES